MRFPTGHTSRWLRSRLDTAIPIAEYRTQMVRMHATITIHAITDTDVTMARMIPRATRAGKAGMMFENATPNRYRTLSWGDATKMSWRRSSIRKTAESERHQLPMFRVLAAWGLIGWRWIWRSPAAAIVPLLQPFFFLYFLHLISSPTYLPLQVAGAMIFSTQNIGSWCLSDSAVFRIELRLQDIFVASPHDKVRYLFGVAFSNIIPALPALVVLGIILATVTSVSVIAWLVIVACILIIWVLYSAIGIAVSSRLRSQREVWPVGNLIFTLLGILSPLYYPLSRLPPVWRELAQLLPATYAALLVQGVLGLEPATNVSLAVDAGLLILSTAVGLVLAWWLYQWRER